MLSNCVIMHTTQLSDCLPRLPFPVVSLPPHPSSPLQPIPASVALAHAVVRQQLASPSPAGALALLLASASAPAVEAAGVGPTARGKHVALSALSAAFQLLFPAATATDEQAACASLSAALQATAAASAPMTGKKTSRKAPVAPVQPAAAAPTAAVVTSSSAKAALGALILASAATLRDEWRGITASLQKLTAARRTAASIKAANKASGVAKAGGNAAAADPASAAQAAADAVQPCSIPRLPAPGLAAPAAAPADASASARDPFRHLFASSVDAAPSDEAGESHGEGALRCRASLVLDCLHRSAVGAATAGADLAPHVIAPSQQTNAPLLRLAGRTVAGLLLSCPPDAVSFDSVAPTVLEALRIAYPGPPGTSPHTSPLVLLGALASSGQLVPPHAQVRALQLSRALLLASKPASGAHPAAPVLLPTLLAALCSEGSTAALRQQVLGCLSELGLSAADASPASAAQLAGFYSLPAFAASSVPRSLMVAACGSQGGATALASAAAALLAASADVIADGAAAARVIATSAASGDGSLAPLLAAHATLAAFARPHASATLLRLAIASAAAAASGAGSAAAAAAPLWPAASATITLLTAHLSAHGWAALPGQHTALTAAFTVARVIAQGAAQLPLEAPAQAAGKGAAASLAAGSPDATLPSVGGLIRVVLTALASLPFELPLVPEGALSAGPDASTAPVLPAALAVLTPALWSRACEGLASEADSLVSQLLALVERGPSVGAAAAARSVLSSLPLPPALLVRQLRACGLACDSAAPAASESSGSATAKARKGSAPSSASIDAAGDVAAIPPHLRFAHAPAVAAKVRSLLTSAAAAQQRQQPSSGEEGAPRSAADRWVARASLLAEVAAASLASASESAYESPSFSSATDLLPLVAPLSSMCEVLVALPSVAAAAASSPTAAASSAAEASSSAAPPSSWSDEDLPAACEFALQGALGALSAIADALTQAQQDGASDDEEGSGKAASPVAVGGVSGSTAAPFDVQMAIGAARTASSSHARGAALGLLGRLSSLAPRATLRQLLPVLLSVGSASLSRDDAYTLSLLSRLVEAVVPPLKAHGRALGVSVHSLLHVFALCAPLVSPHRQGGLFRSLLAAVASTPASESSASSVNGDLAPTPDAAEAGRYLPSLLALLLAQPVAANAAAGVSIASLAGGGSSGSASSGSGTVAETALAAAGVSVPTAASTAAAALAALPALCGGLLLDHPVEEQARALAQLAALAHRLLLPSEDSEEEQQEKEAVEESDGDEEEEEEEDVAARQDSDVRALHALVLAGRSSLADLPEESASVPSAPAAAPASAAVRYKLATALLDFVGSHLSSRPFLAAVVAADASLGSLAAAQAAGSSRAAAPVAATAVGDVHDQAHYLLLAERLFGVLAVASEGRDTAVVRRGEVLAAARAAAAAEAPVDAPAAAAAAAGKKRKAAPAPAASSPSSAADSARSLQRAADSLSSHARFWGSRYEQAYALLGRVATLLAPAAFVALVSSLLTHEDAGIRRRSLGFLNQYLRDAYGAPPPPPNHGAAAAAAGAAAPSKPRGAGAGIGEVEAPLYLSLLEDLRVIVALGALPADHALHAQAAAIRAAKAGDSEEDEEEDDAIGSGSGVFAQVALDSIALLGAYLGPSHPSAFAPVLATVLAVLKTPLPAAAASAPAGGDSASLAVRASALVTLASLASPLGPRLLLPHLPSLLPAVLGALEWTIAAEGAGALAGAPSDDASAEGAGAWADAVSALRLSSLAALRHLVVALPAFVHPFLERSLRSLLHPSVTGGLGARAPPRLVRYDRRVQLPGALSEGLTTGVAVDDAGCGAGEERVKSPPPGVSAAALGMVRAAVAAAAAAPAHEDASIEAAASASALPFSLAPSPSEAAASSSAAAYSSMASDVLSSLIASVVPRLLLPPLLALHAWASDASSQPGPSALVRLTRAVGAVTRGLGRKELREHTPALLRFLMAALDARWRGLSPAAVAAAVAAPSDPVATSPLACASASASLVEVEASCAFTSLALRLSEAALRPLLLRLLTWGACSPDELRAEMLVDAAGRGAAALAGSSASDARAFFAYGCLARRIALFRLLEGLTAVAKSVFLPFYATLLPEIARELTGGAAAAAAWVAPAAAPAPAAAAAAASAPGSAAKATPPTPAVAPATGGKRKAPAEPSPAPTSAKKRVRFAGASDSEEESEATADTESLDSDSEEEQEDEGAAEAGGRATGNAASLAAAGVSYAPLLPLDALPWCPPTLHEGPASGPGLPYTLAPTSPHALRCVLLGCLRAALHYDAAAVDAAASSGGAAASGLLARGGRERLDALLKPLTACFELPLLAVSVPTAAAAAEPAAVAAEPPSGKKAKKAAAPAAAPAAASGAAVVTAAGVPGGRAGYESLSTAYLCPLVSSAVGALGKDTLWKPLHGAVLLLSRDSRPRVRHASLCAARALYDAGGDAALVLLPETLPFLAECLHDSDAPTEAEAQRLLAALEERSGEDLQQYL